VQLIAHPLRWRLMQALIESDRAVSELAEFVRAPQNLVSYHLGLLRDGGLVVARRSSADARDRYYAVDLARCQGELQTTGGALHPGLWLVPKPETPSRRTRRRQRVLFLCTGNSARSQIAEAFLEHLSAGTINAASAGSNPKALHPNAVRVMEGRGIDIARNRTKHVDEFVGQEFDVVVTLCDRVREVCPDFPGAPRLIHWSIPDPALAGANGRAPVAAFERAAAELETRVRFLIQLLDQPSARRSHRDKY
jgi:protein-tyrosine-phosphatase